MPTEQDVIRMQAYKCLRRLGRNTVWAIEDLVSEGQICLDTARCRWKSNGGAAFNTFLTRALMLHFRRIVEKVKRMPPTYPIRKKPDPYSHACYQESDEDMEFADEPSYVWVDRQTHELHFVFRHGHVSDDAEQFLRLVFSPPPCLQKLFRRNGKQPNIAETVRRWLGWPISKMRSVERELRDAAIG